MSYTIVFFTVHGTYVLVMGFATIYFDVTLDLFELFFFYIKINNIIIPQVQ